MVFLVAIETHCRTSLSLQRFQLLSIPLGYCCLGDATLAHYRLLQDNLALPLHSTVWCEQV